MRKDKKDEWRDKRKKKMHDCGSGFKGHMIYAKGISFCGFCGHEKLKNLA